VSYAVESRLARHSMRVQRRQSIAWISVVALTGFSTVVGYKSAYSTTLQREVLARSLAGNIGIQALYGVAHNIDQVGGFTDWRLAWLLGPLLALWGLIASTALTRGEEETGRREFLLAAPTSARGLLRSDLVAIALPQIVCGLVFAIVILAAGAPAGGSFVLGVALALVGLLFGAIGVLVAQLYPDRRHALAAGGAVLGLSFLLRVTADGTSTLGWLRWATPFGWVENVHAFNDTDVVALLALVVTAGACAAIGFVLVTRRDFGSGLIVVQGRSHPDAPWFRGIGRFTFKEERLAAISWAVGIGLFALIFGLLAKDVAAFTRGQSQIQKMLSQLGVHHFDRPQDFLGLMFTFFTLPIAIYAATQVAGARTEESSGRLDVLIVQPLGRRRWLTTRVVAAVLGVVLLAAVAGFGAWIGAAARNSGVGLGAAVAAGVNCIPAAVFFLGAGILFFGLLPRIAPGAAFGVIVVSYLVVLVGELVNMPGWLLTLSPFDHLNPVPAVSIDITAAAVLVAAGALMIIAGVETFARRDLVGA
jgi:ABC-2 type transport system permease protein